MASEQTNFDIDQGTNFRLDLELLDVDGLPVDISTAVIIGQIRKTASSDTIEAEFVMSQQIFLSVNLPLRWIQQQLRH